MMLRSARAGAEHATRQGSRGARTCDHPRLRFGLGSIRMWRALCLSALACAVADAAAGVFPKDFAWGAATAAYQIEGAYRDDGRGMTIWDTFSHTPGKVAGNENGDIADDSYHKYKEDIQLAADMGITHYRFSLAWSRILPTGDFPVNPSGIKFYDRVINLCLDKGIEPFVTLYHWDIPQALEDQYQGWLSEKSIASFARYAEVAFLNFGDRVKYWLTFNEPLTFIDAGYSQGVHAPGRCSDRGRCEQGDSAREPYIVAHNVLRAHARAVAIFRELKLATNRIAHDGEIGITLNIDWAEPRSSSPEDKQAAQRLMEFNLAWFADPIFFGHYPEVMVTNVGDRLPKFTDDEVSLLKGSYDFFGLNHYTSKYVFAPRSPIQHGSYEEDAYIESSYYDEDGNLIGAQGESSWLHVVPWGFRNILNWVADRYDNPGIFVTENGCSVPKENELPVKEALNDDFRVNFYRDYIGNMSLAIEDGVYMRGYFAWSLLDNFEWADGYSVRFGLHYVDYKNGRKRYPKKSAKWYKKYISTVRRKSGTDDDREKDEVSNAEDSKVLPHDIDINEDEPTTAASGRLSTTRGALLSATGIAGAFALVTIASIFGRLWYKRRQHDRIPSRTSAQPRYTPVGSSNGNSTSDREAHEL